MRIYWTIKQIPELAMLSSVERAASWRRVYRKTFRHWQTWIGLLVCAGFAVSGGYIGKALDILYPALLIGAVLGGLIFSQTTIYIARRYYKAELSANF